MTKILLPTRRSDVLRRPRLIEFLHQHIDRRLILISASAGYGKTTLLVDFAHDTDLPVCWYSLDEYDNDPSTFLRYLIAAIRQRFPGFGVQTERLIQNVADASKETKAIVGTLVNEMYSTIPEYFVVVLDDYHAVDGSRSVNELLDSLLFYLPEHCHFIISSRTIPKLTLSRLVARRQAEGLGVNDLRFTPEEIRELMSKNFSVVLPANRAEELAEESEGWITGILLGTHTMWQGLFQTMIRAREAGGQIYDFLATEVFGQQTPEVQHFLLESSTLRQMTPALCDKLLDISNSGELLRYLEDINLFVSRTESDRAWYRYHHLFQEFLQSKLEKENPTRFVQLHLLAAKIYEERQDWNEAFQHYLNAGQQDEAARILIGSAEEMFNSGQWQTVRRWISSLSPQAIARHPEILIHEARVKLRVGEVDQAIEALNRAEDAFQQTDDALNLARVLSWRSVMRRLKGRHKEAIDDSQRAVMLVGNSPTTVAVRARRDLGVAHCAAGDHIKGLVELKLALRIAEEIDDFQNVAGINHEMGTAYMNSGNPELAMYHYERAARYWERVGNAGYLGLTLNGMGVLHYYLGRYDKALEVLGEALGKAREAGHLRVESYVLASIGDVHRDQHRLQEALEAYESSLQVARRVDEHFLAAYCLDAIGMTHLALGNVAQAQKLVEQAIEQVEERKSKYEIGLFKASAGIVLCERGELKQASSVLKQACRYLQQSAANRELARAEFNLARVLFLRHQFDEALTHFKSVLDLVSRLGYDQFLVMEGRRGVDFLRFALSKGVGRDEVRSLLDRIGEEGVAPVTARFASPLSEVIRVAPHSLELHALGSASAFLDGRLITNSEWAVEKTKELLFYFVANPGGMRKEQIVEDLWPDMSPGKGDSNFHSTTYRLRRAIFPDCLIFENGRYRFDSSLVQYYDVHEFENLVRNVESEERPEAKLELLQRAVSLYRGEYLEDIYSDWVNPKREQLEEMHLRALIRLARLHRERREYQQSLDLLQKILAKDAFQEEIHLEVMRCYELMGSRSLAIKHYRQYAELLEEELGEEPSFKTRELYRALLGN